MLQSHAPLAFLALVALAACTGQPGVTPSADPGGRATPGGGTPASPVAPSKTPSATIPSSPGPPAASPDASPSVPLASPSAPAATFASFAAWANRADVAPGPSAREDQTWTVDGDGAIAYLFGGRTPDGASDELWAFDLAAESWSPVNVTLDLPAPAGRWGHTATWVPDIGLVIWSGQSRQGFFDDIWAYDPASNAWTQLPSSGAVPPARYGSCASLGPDGQMWVSHGFTDSGRFDDTRSYDFATGTWTDRTPEGVRPVKRCLQDCFWSADGRFVLYAGQTNGVAALGDLWSLDPATGAWTELVAGAPARQLYSLVPTERGALVFGGAGAEGDFLDDLWLLGADGLAELDAGTTTPAGRSGATLIDDQERDRLLLFGGKNGDGPLGDLWELRVGP